MAPKKKASKAKVKKVTDFYTIGETVGSGAFGIVKKCVQKASGKTFAVKIMGLKKPEESEKVDDDELAGLEASTHKEIMREIDIIKSISHPSIVHFEEYFHHDNKIYLITELLTGGEMLDALLELGVYSEGDARKCFIQLIQGLKYLHKNQVTHRDLKLENLILATKGDITTIKIGDFGLAKSLSEGQLQTVCGSPLYVAPEVVTNTNPGAYTPCVDIWSAGVVLFILLAGYPPFEDENEGVLFDKICAGQYDFDDEAWEEVSAEAKDIVSKLLTIDPKKRITADEALAHPWIKSAECGGELTNVQANVKSRANRLFKKAAMSATMVARVKRMTDEHVGA
eukprot:CAMPEP_0182868158 /NCGR_PEP_ID=MMETSP0034_2-20130328/9142_1 /TAXON_ID=156128 /ORGANISM="Nephroselmis pyriformis, Strain CCMP717" /LENGTH=339 /DNA_ID=CAMNT_0025000549 /DNA_START=370 /DNA_END=1389 /DNA_ORIENTATION=-